MSSWSEQLSAAVRCWRQGDLSEAAGLLREVVISGDPQAVREASHLLGGVLEEQGDIDGARAAHRSVIESGDPVLGQRSAISLGMLLIKTREWPAAHGALSIASEGADSEIAALADAALAQVFARLGDLPAAQAALERARRSTSPEVAELVAQLEPPDVARPRRGAEATGRPGNRAGTGTGTGTGTEVPTVQETYERGERLLDQGALAPAEAVFRQLLTSGAPRFVSLAAFRLFELYAEREEYEGAREVIEHAIAVGHPEHLTMAHKLLGAVLFDLGEFAQAREAYRRAAADPRPDIRLPSLLEEAKLTAHLGDEDAAKAIFRRVIAGRHAGYTIEAKACLGQLHTEAGETADAVAFCGEVLHSGDTRWAGAALACLAVLLDRLDETAPERAAVLALLRTAVGHPDADAAFRAGQLLDAVAIARPLADPVVERALRDTEEAFGLLRAGDLTGARTLLHRAIDTAVDGLSARASTALALLELGEGDVELADELLGHVAEQDAGAQGFGAALFLHLLRSSPDGRHPVLLAALDHQRRGPDRAVARYRAEMEGGDPGTAALATAMLAQHLTVFDLDLPGAAKMFRSAADSGEPLALAYTAVIFAETLCRQNRDDEAIRLLRRARDGGHPALAPWVAHALGTVLAGDLAGDDAALAEARAAFAAVLATGHSGLRPKAQTALVPVLERQGDLLGLIALHERLIAEGHPLQAPRNAWLLGFSRVRLDDLDGARAAFALIPESHPELAREGVFARHLLDGGFDSAASAFAQITALGPDDNRYVMSARLTIETACAWQRCGRIEAADRALSMVAEGQHALAQQAAVRLGVLRNDAGDPAGAIAAWEKAAAGDDAGPAYRAGYGIGRARRALGDLTGAAEAFRSVMEGADDQYAADATLQLGEVLAESGRFTAAHAVFERLVGVGAAAVLQLAAALHRAGDRTAAAKAYRRLADGPDAQVALVAASHLASLLDEQGDAPGAVAVGRRAVAAAESVGDPGRIAQALHGLGGHLAKAGDLAGACEVFERAVAVAVAPEPAASSLLALGECLAAVGDGAGARAAFERAAALDDPRIAARARVRLGAATPRERARVLAEEGDRSGALAVLAELHGSSLPADLPLADLALAAHQGEPAAVRRLLERFAPYPEQAAKAAELVVGAAREHRDGGDDAVARAMLQAVVELGDALEAARAALELAALMAEDGDLVRAERLGLRAAECGDPEVAGLAWRDIAVWRGRWGDTVGAIEAGRRAVGSGHPHAVVGAAPHLATLLEAAGDIAGARAVLGQGAAADHPQAPVCLRALLALLLRRPDHQAAQAAAERAVATGDPQTVAAGHRTSAEIRAAAGDLDEAVRLIRQGIDAGDPQTAAELRVDLARFLHERGEPAAAKAELQAALASAVPTAALGAGRLLGRRLREEGDLAGAAEAFGRAALAGTDAGRPDLAGRTRQAISDITAIAHQAHRTGEHAVVARAVELLARSGADTDAIRIVKDFATTCAAGGDLATACRYYETAMAALGTTAPASFLELDLAELLAEHGGRAKARAMYERLQAHADPDVRFVAGARLLMLLTEDGDEDAAYAIVRRQVDDVDPDAPAAPFLGSLLGVMQCERGDLDAALRTLRVAAKSGEPVAALTLAQTLIQAGELAEGRGICRQVLSAPGAAAHVAACAMVTLGRTYHDEDEQCAREWYLRAVDGEDGHAAVAAAMCLGELGKRRWDFGEALRWYQRVIDSGDVTEAPLAAAHLGELCYWLGDRDGAVRYYEHTLATTAHPDLIGEAAYRLGEIRHLDGDVAAARELLSQAVNGGDDGFAAKAQALLARLTPGVHTAGQDIGS